MSDKFNLDDIMNFDSSKYDVNSKADLDIEKILKDFKSSNDSSDKKLSESSLEFELDFKKDSAKTDMKSETIDSDEIVKPKGVSLTGAFEAIRSEKAEKKQVEDKPEFEESTDDETLEDESTESNVTSMTVTESHEITDDVEKKRFFDTETFNSIKKESREGFNNPITSFAKGDEEEDDGKEEYYQPVEPTEEIDDYDNAEDKEAILTDLRKMSSSASFKSFVTFVLLCISGLLFYSLVGNLNLPALDPVNDRKLFVSIVFGISILASLLNINSVVAGFVGLFKVKCIPETFISMIFVLNTVVNVFNLVLETNNSFVMFDFVYMLLLFFNIYSKGIMAKNILKNFRIVSSDSPKMVVNKSKNETLLNDVLLETGSTGDIIYATKSKFVTDFIHKSFKDFDLCHKNTMFNTIFFFVIVLVGFVYYFTTKNIYNCCVYVTGAFCCFTPLLQAYSFAVPMFNNSKNARKNGGVIVGSSSSFELADAQTIIVDDSDVFNVTLNGIRLYGDSSIDEAIMYLNSLYRTVGGPLNKLFSEMISDDTLSIPRIDEIYYHEKMGYSALIHSKVFVSGNKKLMDHFGIDVDDKEYEVIYQQKSKHVLFVAYDGKLLGVFLLSYSLGHGVKYAFELCEHDQISVAIAERDANINIETLKNNYSPKDISLFKIMNFRTARNCFDKFVTEEKTPSLLTSNTGLKGLISALRGCKHMLFAFKANAVIKNIASVMGFILVSFLLFFSPPSTFLPVQILVYQLLWSIPVLFVSLFSK